MNSKTLSQFFVFALVVAWLPLKAQAYCSSSYCYVSHMPHYNQNGDEVYSRWHTGDNKTTNLCVPTSLSMMLKAVINNHKKDMRMRKKLDINHLINKTNIRIGDWKDRSPASKIHHMAKTVSTSKNGGTSSYHQWLFLRRAHRKFFEWSWFSSKGRRHYGNSKNVSVGTLKHYLRNHGKPAPLYMAYSHCRGEDSSLWGGAYTFRDVKCDGGHAITARSYYHNYLNVYDPWYKRKYWTKVKKANSGWHGKTYVSLPGGRDQIALVGKKAGSNYYPMLKRYASFGRK